MLGIRRIVTMVTLIHFSSVTPKLHVHKAYVKKNYIIIERNAIQSYSTLFIIPAKPYHIMYVVLTYITVKHNDERSKIDDS